MEHKFHLLLLDIFVFIFMALIFGLLIEALFPEPAKDEDILLTIVLFFGQVITDTIIIYFLGYGYEKIVGRDADLYYGFTMFMLIFFLVQVQLFNRIRMIYHFFFPKINV